MIPRLPGRRGWTEPSVPALGKAMGMRTSSTWRVALALLLVLPLAGACKKKGPRPGEGGAGGAGLGEEGLGASVSTISYGKELPLCHEENDACWARNRRVHSVILGQ